MNEEKLLKILEEYRNVLEFYAHEETYHIDRWGSPIERDSGDLARKALQENTFEDEASDPYEPTPPNEYGM